MMTSRRKFPVPPLVTIVRDADWRRLSSEEKREVRRRHAKQLARMRRELKR
jgi:hypothetical protein